jgi:hypothetical protein
VAPFCVDVLIFPWKVPSRQLLISPTLLSELGLETGTRGRCILAATSPIC